MRLMSRAALALAATLLAPAAMHAQTSFIVAAGAAVPIGNTGDAVKMGYNATLGIGIKPPLAPIGLRIDGMFNSFEYDAIDASLRLLAGTANVTLSSPALPIGYLIGGLGMYNASTSGTSGSETDFGFNVGAGLNFPLTGFSTFLEARLHVVNSEGESVKFIPITFGLRF
jgi:hypothetical protein